MIPKNGQTCVSAKSSTHILTAEDTRLYLGGKPFPFQGLSFFNAIYNPTFNQSETIRSTWLGKFKGNGVNALRVWCQWDFEPPLTFADVKPDCSMYTSKGDIREKHFQKLAALLKAADRLEMVIEVTLFSREKQPPLSRDVQVRATQELAKRLLPYRNSILQIWNENSSDVALYYEAIKMVDPQRIVTNSPGISNVLGDDHQNRMLDILTPHTVRTETERFWEVAPMQIARLIERFGKAVIDDEPARSGMVEYGGIEGGTTPEQHIEQIRRVREIGGYHTYHHAMFQGGYGHPDTPPSGIPDPDFSPFHRKVFDFLRSSRV